MLLSIRVATAHPVKLDLTGQLRQSAHRYKSRIFVSTFTTDRVLRGVDLHGPVARASSDRTALLVSGAACTLLAAC